MIAQMNKKDIKIEKISNSMADISQKWLKGIDTSTFEIADVFTRGYNKKMHGSEIARLLHLPQRTISRKLDLLCNFGILKFTREGKNKIYYLNKTTSAAKQFMILVEGYKAFAFVKKNSLAAQLFHERPCDLIVFGSYAKGNSKKDSDLDVVFLSGKNRKIEEFISKSPVEIHAHFSNLLDMDKKIKGKDALALEIKENHVIFGNIEEIVQLFMGDKDE